MDQRTLAVQCLPDPKPWPKCGLLGHVASEHQESTEVCHFLPCACRTNIISVQGCCQFGCPWVGMQCIQTFQVLWPRSLIRYIYGLRKHRQTPRTWSSALRYMFIPVDSSKPPSVVGSCECMKWRQGLSPICTKSCPNWVNFYNSRGHWNICISQQIFIICYRQNQHICVCRKEKDLCVVVVATKKTRKGSNSISNQKWNRHP